MTLNTVLLTVVSFGIILAIIANAYLFTPNEAGSEFIQQESFADSSPSLVHLEVVPHKFQFSLRRDEPNDQFVYESVRSLFLNNSHKTRQSYVFTHSYCDSRKLLCDFEIRHHEPRAINRECLVPLPSSSSSSGSDDSDYQSTAILQDVTLSSLITTNVTDAIGRVIEFVNIRTNSYLSENGEISSLGRYANHLESNLFSSLVEDNAISQQHEDRFARRFCNRVQYSDWIANRSLFVDHLLRQEPIAIDGIPVTSPPLSHQQGSRSEEILRQLRRIQQHTVGVKLSPDAHFEGIDLLTNWGMAASQFVPRQILDQMQSPDLVVVRPAHKDMTITDLFKLFVSSSISSASSPNPLSSNTDIVNAYVEYLPIRNDPSHPLRQFIDSIFPKQSIANDANDRNISLLINIFPSFVDSTLRNGKGHIWIGDGRAIGKLHFDPFDNLLVQIDGEKTFLLVDASANERFLEGHMREAEIEVEMVVGNELLSNLVYVNDKENSNEKKKRKNPNQLELPPNADPATIRGQFERHKLSESTSMVHSPIGSLRVALNSLLSAIPDTNSQSKMNNKFTKKQYDPHSWDDIVKRYPQSASIPNSILECTVPANSAIFVPSYWWHEVESRPGQHVDIADWTDVVHAFHSSNVSHNNHKKSVDTNDPHKDSVDIQFNVAANFWFEPLFEKEFPCPLCRKRLNPKYRELIAALHSEALTSVSTDITTDHSV